MTEYLITGASARWAVLWLVQKKGRKPFFIEHEFGNDLSEALRVRDLALRAGKRFVTLRSMNVGFPPPEKYQPHYETVHDGYKIVKRKGKRFRKKKYIDIWVVPMGVKNAEGTWWCPYCMKFRRFKLRDGYGVNDAAHHCPVCNISSRDFHVRKWNPVANRNYNAPKRARRSNGSKRRRRRT